MTDAAEGLALRGAGVAARILLMTGIWKGEEDGIVAQNLTPTIWEPWHIEIAGTPARLHKSANAFLPVHLKIDTGMNRLGASREALPRLCEMLSACKHLTSRRSEHAFRVGGSARRRRRGAADEMLRRRAGDFAESMDFGRRWFTWEIPPP